MPKKGERSFGASPILGDGAPGSFIASPSRPLHRAVTANARVTAAVDGERLRDFDLSTPASTSHERSTEEYMRPFAEMLAPISASLDSPLELPQI